MRVAFVVSDLSYPPREGLHQQSLLMLSALSGRGIQISLMGYCKNLARLDLARLERETSLAFQQAPIENVKPSLLVGIRNRLPLQLTRREKAMLRELDRSEYDVIHLEGAAACGLFRRRNAHRTILGIIDPPSRRRMRMARVKGGVLRRVANFALSLTAFLFEESLNHRTVAWHVVSNGDAEYLVKRHRHEYTYSIPVLVPAFAGDVGARSSNCGQMQDSSISVVIYVDLRHSHMRRALTRLIHAINSGPNHQLRFTVLGRTAPSPELLSLTQGLPFKFVDWVDDYVALLRSADIILVPDEVGTGLKNRTLQSMMLGKAIVGSAVAFEGIPARDGVEALVYSDVAEVPDKLARLGDDADVRAEVGRAGRDLVLATFGEERVVGQWLELYARQSGTPRSEL